MKKNKVIHYLYMKNERNSDIKISYTTQGKTKKKKKINIKYHNNSVVVIGHYIYIYIFKKVAKYIFS